MKRSMCQHFGRHCVLGCAWFDSAARASCSSKGCVVKKQCVLNKKKMAQLVSWSMRFNSKTHEVSCWQGNDVPCLMKFLMLIVCVTVIMILLLIFLLIQVRIELGFAEHVWQDQRGYSDWHSSRANYQRRCAAPIVCPSLCPCCGYG